MKNEPGVVIIEFLYFADAENAPLIWLFICYDEQCKKNR